MSETEKYLAGIDTDADFDKMEDGAQLEKDTIGRAVREWAKHFESPWAQIVASYVCGSTAKSLGCRLQEHATLRLAKMMSRGSDPDDLAYLRTLADCNPVVLGLNIHLLIHVIEVDQAAMEAYAPQGELLTGRIWK